MTSEAVPPFLPANLTTVAVEVTSEGVPFRSAFPILKSWLMSNSPSVRSSAADIFLACASFYTFGFYILDSHIPPTSAIRSDLRSMDPSGIYANCQVARDQRFEHECHETGPQHTREVLEQQLHEKNQKGWRRIALNFTPSCVPWKSPIPSLAN